MKLNSSNGCATVVAHPFFFSILLMTIVKSGGNLADITMSERLYPFELRLYIVGQTPEAHRAALAIRRICEVHLKHRYSFIVVDVQATPDLVEVDEEISVPTLIRVFPDSSRKLVGDLHDDDNLLWFLGLK